MKKVAVLFSGGLDSTFLIWKNLKDGNEVFPIYIKIENNKIKTILEKNRINLLYNKFFKEFESNINEIQYVVNVGIKGSEDCLYFKQMPIWIFSLMFMQSMEVDEIQIGYVSNDDAISYLDDIQNIYKSYQAICEPMKPLVFPLTKWKKYAIFQDLPKQYRDLIISCENAKIIGDKKRKIIQYEPCCDCGSCKTIIKNNYYELNEYPKNYHKPLVDLYARQLRKLKYRVVDKNGVDYFEKNIKLEHKKKSI